MEFQGMTVDELRDQLDMVAYAQTKLGGTPRRVGGHEIRIVGVGAGGLQINTQRRVYSCFASAVGGDALDLVGWCEPGMSGYRDDPEKFKHICEIAASFIMAGTATPTIEPWHPNIVNRGRVTGTYKYTDAHGRILFIKERFEQTIEGVHLKTFLCKQPDGTPGLNDGLPVLYKLHEVAMTLESEPSTIIVVEGEKCADALRAHGFTTTTAPFGAGDWDESYTEALTGASHVYLLPDNDQEGRRHMEAVAAALIPHVGCLKLIELPDLPHKGDIVDWLNGGNSIEDLKIIVNKTPEWTPKPSRPILQAMSADDLLATPYSPIRWSVNELLPERVCLLAGRPKAGKSWLALQISCAVATGESLLEAYESVPGDVLYCGLEDSPRRLKSRLESMRYTGSLPRLHLLTTLPSLGKGCLDGLTNWCDHYPAARLIVVDTLAKITPTRKRGADPYQEDYGTISSLQKLALDRGITILLVHHMRKMESESLLDEVHGSTALTGGADTILLLKKPKIGPATLNIIGRDVSEEEFHIVHNHDTFRWEPLVHQSRPSLSEERQKILACLKGSPLPLTPSVIATKIDKSRESVQKLCLKMKADGLLGVTDHGQYHILDSNHDFEA